MRKYIRNIIRARAKKQGNKPSRYVRDLWGRLQVKKYGIPLYSLCVGAGTGRGHLNNHKAVVVGRKIRIIMKEGKER